MLRKKPSVKSTEFQKNIALRFSYDGSRYSGLASQKNYNTIDFQLKKALINSNLANPDVKITYAGRTDSGVSGINMVASLFVHALPDDRSFNYDTILNSHLPPEIRITGYTFVSSDFNARYSCKKRSYTYFFLKNSLNIQKMRLAGKFILSQTNFKYFCKGHKDEEDSYFHRPISSLEILEDDICKMNISSVSFLHNMVRKIFYVIKLVGGDKITLEELCEYFEGKRPVGTADPEFLLFIGAEYDNLKFKHNLRDKEKEFLIAYVSKIVHENVFEIENDELKK